MLSIEVEGIGIIGTQNYLSADCELQRETDLPHWVFCKEKKQKKICQKHWYICQYLVTTGNY